MNARRRGSLSQDFRCRAYRLNLSPLEHFGWPLHHTNQEFILSNYKDVLSLLIILNQHLSVIQPLF